MYVCVRERESMSERFFVCLMASSSPHFAIRFKGKFRLVLMLCLGMHLIKKVIKNQAF